MSDYTAILCPHGRATSWTGISRPGERLPAVEHCEECNPGAVALEVHDVVVTTNGGDD